MTLVIVVVDRKADTVADMVAGRMVETIVLELALSLLFERYESSGLAKMANNIYTLNSIEEMVPGNVGADGDIDSGSPSTFIEWIFTCPSMWTKRDDDNGSRCLNSQR